MINNLTKLSRQHGGFLNTIQRNVTIGPKTYVQYVPSVFTSEIPLVDERLLYKPSIEDIKNGKNDYYIIEPNSSITLTKEKILAIIGQIECTSELHERIIAWLIDHVNRLNYIESNNLFLPLQGKKYDRLKKDFIIGYAKHNEKIRGDIGRLLICVQSLKQVMPKIPDPDIKKILTEEMLLINTSLSQKINNVKQKIEIKNRELLASSDEQVKKELNKQLKQLTKELDNIIDQLQINTWFDILGKTRVGISDIERVNQIIENFVGDLLIAKFYSYYDDIRLFIETIYDRIETIKTLEDVKSYHARSMSELNETFKKIIPYYDSFSVGLSFCNPANHNGPFEVYYKVDDKYYLIEQNVQDREGELVKFVLNEDYVLVETTDIETDKIVNQKLQQYDFVLFSLLKYNSYFDTIPPEELYEISLLTEIIFYMKNPNEILNIYHDFDKSRWELTDLSPEYIRYVISLKKVLKYLYVNLGSEYVPSKQIASNIVNTFFFSYNILFLHKLIELVNRSLLDYDLVPTNYFVEKKIKDSIIAKTKNIKYDHENVFDFFIDIVGSLINDMNINNFTLLTSVIYNIEIVQNTSNTEEIIREFNNIKIKFIKILEVVQIHDTTFCNMVKSYNFFSIYEQVEILKQKNQRLQSIEILPEDTEEIKSKKKANIKSAVQGINDQIKKINSFMKRSPDSVNINLIFDTCKFLFLVKDLHEKIIYTNFSESKKRKMIRYIINTFVSTRIKYNILPFNVNLLFTKFNRKIVPDGTTFLGFVPKETDIKKFYDFITNNSYRLFGYIKAVTNMELPKKSRPDLRPDCGETTILNLINYLICDDNGKLHAEWLPPNCDPRLRDFYERFNTLDEAEKTNNRINYFDPIFQNHEFVMQNIDFYLNNPDKMCVYKTSTFYPDSNPQNKSNYEDTFDMYTYDPDGNLIPGTQENRYCGWEIRPGFFTFLRLFIKVFGINDPDLQENKLFNKVTRDTFKSILEQFRNPNIANILSNYKCEPEDFSGDQNWKFSYVINFDVGKLNIRMSYGHSKVTYGNVTSDKSGQKDTITTISQHYNLGQHVCLFSNTKYTFLEPEDLWMQVYFCDKQHKKLSLDSFLNDIMFSTTPSRTLSLDNICNLFTIYKNNLEPEEKINIKYLYRNIDRNIIDLFYNIFQNRILILTSGLITLLEQNQYHIAYLAMKNFVDKNGTADKVINKKQNTPYTFCVRYGLNNSLKLLHDQYDLIRKYGENTNKFNENILHNLVWKSDLDKRKSFNIENIAKILTMFTDVFGIEKIKELASTKSKENILPIFYILNAYSRATNIIYTFGPEFNSLVPTQELTIDTLLYVIDYNLVSNLGNETRSHEIIKFLFCNIPNPVVKRYLFLTMFNNQKYEYLMRKVFGISDFSLSHSDFIEDYLLTPISDIMDLFGLNEYDYKYIMYYFFVVGLKKKFKDVDIFLCEIPNFKDIIGDLNINPWILLDNNNDLFFGGIYNVYQYFTSKLNVTHESYQMMYVYYIEHLFKTLLKTQPVTHKEENILCKTLKKLDDSIEFLNKPKNIDFYCYITPKSKINPNIGGNNILHVFAYCITTLFCYKYLRIVKVREIRLYTPYEVNQMSEQKIFDLAKKTVNLDLFSIFNKIVNTFNKLRTRHDIIGFQNNNKMMPIDILGSLNIYKYNDNFENQYLEITEDETTLLILPSQEDANKKNKVILFYNKSIKIMTKEYILPDLSVLLKTIVNIILVYIPRGVEAYNPTELTIREKYVIGRQLSKYYYYMLPYYNFDSIYGVVQIIREVINNFNTRSLQIVTVPNPLLELAKQNDLFKSIQVNTDFTLDIFTSDITSNFSAYRDYMYTFTDNSSMIMARETSNSIYDQQLSYKGLTGTIPNRQPGDILMQFVTNRFAHLYDQINETPEECENREDIQRHKNFSQFMRTNRIIKNAVEKIKNSIESPTYVIRTLMQERNIKKYQTHIDLATGNKYIKWYEKYIKYKNKYLQLKLGIQL